MNNKALKGMKAASRAKRLAHIAANGRTQASTWGGTPSRKADRRANKKALKGGW